MSDFELQQALVDRFSNAQSRTGRYRLRVRASAKRIIWRFAVVSALRVKRTFDVIFSFMMLAILSPLFAAIALWIKIDDRGPVFFKQRRVGKDGREFFMYKFRSMCVDAEARMAALLSQNQHQSGLTFKIKNDPRITWIGKWLRKFSLDELPQFYNVLRGDMSLVGPRPPLPREVALYKPSDRWRLAVKPGITCFWQVGGRSEIDFDGQVQLDVLYIESQSLWTDITILLKTIPAVLFSKGAY